MTLNHPGKQRCLVSSFCYLWVEYPVHDIVFIHLVDYLYWEINVFQNILIELV